MYPCREYGYFTMESLIATAFGRYVNLQRGEADKITKEAKEVFKSTQEESVISPQVILACLCTFHTNLWQVYQIQCYDSS